MAAVRTAASTKYRHMITSYAEDVALFRTGVRKLWLGLLFLALAVAPVAGTSLGGNYVPYLLKMTGIAVIVALGLNLLTGSAGLVSLGHAAFLAIGAYTAGFLANRLGFPFWMTVTIAGGLTGVVGLVVSYSVSCRLKGLSVRMALGASRARIVNAAVKAGGLGHRRGLFAGLALSVGLDRVVALWSFGNLSDPIVLVAVALVMFVVRVMSAAIPANRAASIQPADALRRD